MAILLDYVLSMMSRSPGSMIGQVGRKCSCGEGAKYDKGSDYAIRICAFLQTGHVFGKLGGALLRIEGSYKPESRKSGHCKCHGMPSEATGTEDTGCWNESYTIIRIPEIS